MRDKERSIRDFMDIDAECHVSYEGEEHDFTDFVLVGFNVEEQTCKVITAVEFTNLTRAILMLRSLYKDMSAELPENDVRESEFSVYSDPAFAEDVAKVFSKEGL